MKQTPTKKRKIEIPSEENGTFPVAAEGKTSGWKEFQNISAGEDEVDEEDDDEDDQSNGEAEKVDKKGKRNMW